MKLFVDGIQLNTRFYGVTEDEETNSFSLLLRRFI